MTVQSRSFAAFLRQVRLLPTISFHEAGDLRALLPILQAAGYPALELLHRTPFTWEALELVRREAPELIVGVGTLLSEDDMAKARAGGAAFGASPGFQASLCAWAQRHSWPYLPGVSTPSDLQAAHGLGLVKFFPAAALGVPYLKQILAAFPQVQVVPSGGLDASNCSSFAALPQVVCLSGSWMIERAALAQPAALVAALRTLRASLIKTDGGNKLSTR